MTGAADPGTGWPIRWFDEIDSTNEEARRCAETSPFENQWLAARQQTAGRGRLGRKWMSPPGNLFATALLNWPFPLDVATRLPFAVALAVRETVCHFAPASDPKLKWPNDVRIDGAKISGILIESGTARSERWIAVGVGLNVAYAPEVLEQATICISTLSATQPASTEDVLDVLAAAFLRQLDRLIDSFAPLRADWLKHAESLGEDISVSSGEKRISGIFETLGPDGALILRLPNGERETIRAGDVTIRQGPRHAPRN